MYIYKGPRGVVCFRQIKTFDRRRSFKGCRVSRIIGLMSEWKPAGRTLTSVVQLRTGVYFRGTETAGEDEWDSPSLHVRAALYRFPPPQGLSSLSRRFPQQNAFTRPCTGCATKTLVRENNSTGKSTIFLPDFRLKRFELLSHHIIHLRSNAYWKLILRRI